MQERKYKQVDRSRFKPTFIKKDSDDAIDLGYTESVFTDGRPFRIESWATHQTSFLTYYFSSIDMEDFSESDLKEYLTSEQVIQFHDERFLASGYTGINVEAKKSFDDSGNQIWEVTVIVGDEDGTYVRDSIALQRYEKEKS